LQNNAEIGFEPYETELKLKVDSTTVQRGKMSTASRLQARLHSEQCDEDDVLARENAAEQRNYSFSGHSIVEEERGR
jgi:hypothetical protein